MTGITAIFSAADAPAGGWTQTMASLASRPHDSCGEWARGAAMLGACVRHATAESRDAAQPCLSEDEQLAVVLDGYLANHAELRSDLQQRGAMVRNRSDCELVLRAYEAWGEDCLTRLDGEFAFIVVDLRRGSLFCARDHMGLRPLHYRVERGAIYVASHVADLVEPLGEAPAPDPGYLAQVISAELSSSRETAWTSISKVPPAGSLVFRSGRARVQSYYSLAVEVDRRPRPDADFVEEYRYLLADAIRRSSRSDALLAFEVSGGLDSSSLFCLAHQLRQRGELPAPDLAGYTLRGEAGSPADEIAYARAAADHVGATLFETPLHQPPLDFYRGLSARERDIATYPNAAQSIGLEARMVADGARVLIGGAGGDQLLDGTRGYVEQAVRSLDPARWLRNTRTDILALGARAALATTLRRSVLAMLPTGLRARLRSLRLHGEPVAASFLSEACRAAVEDGYRAYRAGLPRDPVAICKLSSFHSPWTHFATDLMARQRSQIGLETRSPFFNRRLMEFCASLPEDLKLRGRRNRWIHREAMDGILPEMIARRTDKANFPSAYCEQEILAELAGDLPEILSRMLDHERFDHFLRNYDPEQDAYELWGVWIVTVFLLENCSPGH